PPGTGLLGPPDSGIQALDLNGFYPGWITRSDIPTVPGRRYLLSHAYCRNPNSGDPNFLATADVLLNGQLVRSLSYGNFNTAANLNWFINQVLFTATTNNTTLDFRSTTTTINTCGTPCGGMYLDTVRVNELASVAGGCNYVFPEEPLSQMRGENAYGTWRMEIWDNRVGAPITAQLVSWQLDFDFVSTNPPVTLLTNSQCFSGTAAGSNVSYFRIRVPFVAGYATNTLTT